jgi:hypothetical protein
MMKRDFIIHFPFVVGVFDEEDDDSSDEQCRTDKKRVGKERFYIWIYEKAGDTSGDESCNQTFNGGDGKDFLPVHVEHGENCSKLYSYLKDHEVVRLRNGKKMRDENEVSCGGDGEEFSETLDDAQVERLE